MVQLLICCCCAGQLASQGFKAANDGKIFTDIVKGGVGHIRPACCGIFNEAFRFKKPHRLTHGGSANPSNSAKSRSGIDVPGASFSSRIRSRNVSAVSSPSDLRVFTVICPSSNNFLNEELRAISAIFPSAGPRGHEEPSVQ